MSYNGWSNYETWLVNIWMTNDEFSYDMYMGLARNAAQMYNPRAYLASAIKDLIEESAPEVTGLYADMLNASLSAIDYYELADSALADLEG